MYFYINHINDVKETVLGLRMLQWFLRKEQDAGSVADAMGMPSACAVKYSSHMMSLVHQHVYKRVPAINIINFDLSEERHAGMPTTNYAILNKCLLASCDFE